MDQETRASDSTQVRRYPAARSAGWFWLILIALLCFAIAGASLLAAQASGSFIGALAMILSAAVLVILGLMTLLLSGWSRTVRYELSPERLVLFCGPIRYNVLLADVKRVSKQDLRMSIWSSTRFPGFALGNVPCGGIGNVVMCSTRSLKGIILIETGTRKYGITPVDEESFLADLTDYLEAS